MKKYKLLVFLIPILFLTGCDATYNLTITNDKMVESADFVLDKNSQNQQTLEEYQKMKYSAYYNLDTRVTHYYKQTEINENNKIGMNLTYEYSFDNLQKSALLDRCYYKKSVINNDDYIIITTDGQTRCFYKDDTKFLDSLTINIKTDLEVIENNADKVNKGVYTWYITKDNLNDKPINIKIKKDAEKEGINPLIILSIVLGSIVVILGAIATFMYIKQRKNNKL